MKPFTATDEKISFLFLLTCDNLKRPNNRYNLEKKKKLWDEAREV